MCLEKKLKANIDEPYHAFLMNLTELKTRRNSIKGFLQTLNKSQLENALDIASRNKKHYLIAWIQRELKKRRVEVTSI